MFGKRKCRILKEIRQKIADENDIPYVTSECSHKGECAGTCPRCESELRYLERQLEIRASLGKRVSVAALCAGLALASAGCGPAGAETDPPGVGAELSGAMVCETPAPTAEPVIEVTTGEVAWPEDTTTGMVPYEETEPPEPADVPWELMGDVAWAPEADRG